MIITHAMVLAAGFGTRMQPLTAHTPKPLLAVAEKPLLDWAIDHLARAGCANTLVNVHYLKSQIEDHLQNRAGVTCIAEDPILETGGGIQNALNLGLLGDGAFYACNADNLWIDHEGSALLRMADAWDPEIMDALLLIHPTERAHGYDGNGDFLIDERDETKCGPLHRYKKLTTSLKSYVFTGVQLLHPRLFTNAPGGAYSLNVLYDEALANSRLFGIVHTGDWYHVGTPDALTATHEALLRGLTNNE